jgi:hypothetical protein
MLAAVGCFITDIKKRVDKKYTFLFPVLNVNGHNSKKSLKKDVKLMPKTMQVVDLPR